MRSLFGVFLAVSSAFAIAVTSPGGTSGWSTSGPNILEWNRVSTDPTTFAVFLVNQNPSYSELLDGTVDATAGTTVCSAPSGGWPIGTDFQVNIAQDSSNPNSLLAQSSDFNITAGSSNQSTTSPASTQTASPTVTTSGSSISSSGTSTTPNGTTSGSSISSSDTSTTPTGTSAAPLSADTRASLVAAVAALMALVTTIL